MPKISKAGGPSYGVEDALAQQAMDPHAPIEQVRGAREAIMAGRVERSEDGQDPNAVGARDVAYAEKIRQADARAQDESLSDRERESAEREAEALRREYDEHRGAAESVQRQSEQDKGEARTETGQGPRPDGSSTMPGITGNARGTVSEGGAGDGAAKSGTQADSEPSATGASTPGATSGSSSKATKSTGGTAGKTGK